MAGKDDSKTPGDERTGDVKVEADDATFEVSNIGSDEDPNPHRGGGHRHAVRAVDGDTTLTAEDGDGDDRQKITWVDPDALPGTSGDDPAETIRAAHAAGLPAVTAEPVKGKGK